MSFLDKTLLCRECGAEFAFTADHQQQLAARGITTEPKRCATCQQRWKMIHARTPPRRRGKSKGPAPTAGAGPAAAPRQTYPVTCAACGKRAQVPFRPIEGRPVYCRECHQARAAAR